MANSITYSRMFFLIPIGFALYAGNSMLALVLFVRAALTDWLDGFVARRFDRITETGKVMDQIADKVLITGILIFLVDLKEIPSWLLVSIVWRDLVVSATRILAASTGRIIAANVFGKIKTVFQFVLVIWILSWGFEPVTTFLVWSVFLLTVLSGVVYVYQNRSVFRT